MSSAESRPSSIKRGDWLAYEISGDRYAGDREDGRVLSGRAWAWTRCWRLPGDRVRFTPQARYVNDQPLPLAPHMPAEGELVMPEKVWFIWPTLDIYRAWRARQRRSISATMQRTAMVTQKANHRPAVQTLVWPAPMAMSRFSNLEFGDESEDQAPEQKALVKDEAYYLAEARAAFENGNFESALRLYSKVLEFNPQNAAAWAGQVRMLIELGEYREAKLWADKALERFPHEPELLAAKAVALARSGDLQGALAFSDASIEERGDTPYIWLARGDVLLAREEARADYCFEKALLLAPAGLVHRLAGGADSLFLRAVRARAQAAAAGPRVERRPFPALAGDGPMPAGPGAGWPGAQLLHPGPATESPLPRSAATALASLSAAGLGLPDARLVATTVQPLTVHPPDEERESGPASDRRERIRRLGPAPGGGRAARLPRQWRDHPRR